MESSASATMFCSKQEATKNSYETGSDNFVPVATGKDPAKCIGTSNIDLNGIRLEGMHIRHLNDTLISVGHIVIFTSREAVILR